MGVGNGWISKSFIWSWNIRNLEQETPQVSWWGNSVQRNKVPCPRSLRAPESDKFESWGKKDGWNRNWPTSVSTRSCLFDIPHQLSEHPQGEIVLPRKATKTDCCFRRTCGQRWSFLMHSAAEIPQHSWGTKATCTFAPDVFTLCVCVCTCVYACI